MITRKLETELDSFHYDDLTISEITTETSWMKLHVFVLFIKDNVQITKELYKDYETGLWYCRKNNGMILSHKDTFDRTIKNLVSEMIIDVIIELDTQATNEETTEGSETEETTEVAETEETNATDEEINENKEIEEPTETTPTYDTKAFYGIYGQFPSISDMYNDKCFCCLADRKGNECKGKETCGKTWKRFEAIAKPEWHNVSLATLANIDFDMLDEKRQTYLTAFRDLRQTLTYLRKCKTQDTYDTCFIRYIKRKNHIFAENKISYAMYRYIDAKLSMQNVESGVWASKCEQATGYHVSRRYNKSRV